MNTENHKGLYSCKIYIICYTIEDRLIDRLETVKLSNSFVKNMDINVKNFVLLKTLYTLIQE